MLRMNSASLLSSASVIAIIISAAATGSALAAPHTGSIGPIVNNSDNNDTFTAANVGTNGGTNASNTALDPANDSYRNNVNMLNAGNNVLITAASVLQGDLENAGTMTATGANDSVLINGASHINGRFFNAGAISGGANAIDVDAGSSIDSGIFNISTISASVIDGIRIGATSTVSGGITNSGVIQGNRNGIGLDTATSTLNGDITNNATGTIIATGSGGAAFAMTGGTVNGSINNSGQMLAQVSGGIGVNITGGNFTGTINNQTGGAITASNNAVHIANPTFNGSVTNSGAMLSFGSGILADAVTFNGSITNQVGGLIHSFESDGIDIEGTTFAGALTNNGSIFAGKNGIFVADSTTVTNQNVVNGFFGVITAAQVGMRIDGVVNNNVVNNGVIDPAVGIQVNGEVLGAVINTGTINATNTGIDLTEEDSETTVNQEFFIGKGATPALLRANSIADGSGTIGFAIDAENGFTDTFNIDSGQIDGNVRGDVALPPNPAAGDILNMNPVGGDTVAWLQGEGTGLAELNTGGDGGDVILGAAFRGDPNGRGVTINTIEMNVFFGRTYIDDNTVINVEDEYTNEGGEGGSGVTEFLLTGNTAQHGVINADFINTQAENIAAYIDGVSIAAVGGDHFLYTGVMNGITDGSTDIIQDNRLFFEAEAIFSPDRVDIEVDRLSFTDATLFPVMTHNEFATGNALDNVYALGPGPTGYGPDMQALFGYFFDLPDTANGQTLYLHALNEIDGAEYAQLEQVTLDILNPFNTYMGQRLDAAKFGAGGTYAEIAQPRYAQGSNIMSDYGAARGASGMSVWGRGYGNWAKIDGDAEANGYKEGIGGVVVGMDMAFPGAAIAGIALGWSNGSVDFDQQTDHADIDSFQLGGYGSWLFGRYYVDGTMAGAWHDLTTQRFIDIPFAAGGPKQAGAAYNADSFLISGEFGGVWGWDHWMLQPNFGLTFTNVDSDSFVESGAGDLNLIAGSTSASSFASTLGIRVATSYFSNGMNFLPELSVAWRHEFEDDHQSITFAFPDLPTAPFSIVSSSISDDSAMVEAGVSAAVAQNVEVFVNYNGLYNSDVTVNNASLGLRATW